MNVFWTLLICIQQSLVDLPFSALTLLVRRQEGHTACKKNWMLGFAGGNDLTGALHDL